MLQEMKPDKAVKASVGGKKVWVFPKDGDQDRTLQGESLEVFLSRYRLVVDVVAIIDHEFEAAVQDMAQSNLSGQKTDTPPEPLMKQLEELPLAPRNRPASVWVPVSNGKR